MKFAQALQDFYEEQEYKGNSPATIALYRANIEHYQRDTGNQTLEEFTVATIRRWLLAHKHLSPNSLATYDRAVRVFASWLHRRGYLKCNPMAELPKPRGKRSDIITFNRDEIRDMLREASRRQNPLRERALITLLLDTGVRIGEATGIELEHIHWTEGMVSVDGKSGTRIVPFGRKAKQALKRYIEEERTAQSPIVRGVFLTQTGETPTPQAATHTIRKVAETAKVKASKLGPHTFRHTFAVEFIRAGGDAFSLQRILGHTSLDMTLRYVHLANSDLHAAPSRPAARLARGRYALAYPTARRPRTPR